MFDCTDIIKGLDDGNCNYVVDNYGHVLLLEDEPSGDLSIFSLKDNSSLISKQGARIVLVKGLELNGC